MTEPTDKELDAVIAEYQTRIYPQDMQPRFERAIMRAAIAKFGTPPAVAGEPVATIKSWTNGSYWRNYKVEWHRNDLPEGAQLYTTPQPTRAGAVPLTDEQLHEERQTAISQLFDLAQQWADNKIHSYQFGHEAEKIVNAVARRVEAAHGIKVGQP